MDYAEIVAEGEVQAVIAALEAVMNALTVKMIRAPAPAMVMVKRVDPVQRTPFYLGEAYVMECEVEVDGFRGYGCVLGESEERALCAAIADAVIAGGHPNAAEMMALLESEAARIEERWEAESRAVASTRVSFEVR